MLFFLLACFPEFQDRILPDDPLQDYDGDGYLDDVDCDDRDRSINPAASEVCDVLGVDENCDGLVNGSDAIDAPTWYLDEDNDRFGDPTVSMVACAQPENYIDDNSDCDDTNPRVFPGSNNEMGLLCVYDEDGDGYGDMDPPAPFDSGTDCDDTEALNFPNNLEYCDEIDNNCNDEVDEGAGIGAQTWYLDSDSDGYGQSAASVLACDPPSSYVALAADCNDQDGSVYPNATEYCDGIDNNCDGVTDEPTALDASTWYLDNDSDGYGTPFVSQNSCSQPSPDYVSNNTDCNDGNDAVHPAASESCNTIDDNCDGTVDEAGANGETFYYIDSDLDGYGDANYQSVSNGSFAQCSSQFDTSSNYVTNADDCNDADDALNPETFWYVDADLDGFGNDSIFFQSCQAPYGYVSSGGDCDDTISEVYPGALELCNGQLDNCNTTIGLTNGIPENEHDFDEDGFVECTLDVATNIYIPSSTDPNYLFLGGEDCDDADNLAYPNAVELCNGAFENCSDSAYSALGAPDTEIDDDGDFYVECIGFDSNTWEGDIDVYNNALLGNGGGNDCDDTRDYTHPGAAPQTSATECLTDFDGDGFADCRFGSCDSSLTINGEQMDFVNIPAGVFMMGSTFAPFLREVTLTNDFEAMTTHVTVGMFEAVMGYPHSDGVAASQPFWDQSDEYPATWISWHMAADFANELTQYSNMANGTSLQMCYSCTGSGPSVSCVDTVNAYQCTGYRLLTEAEWEYMAKSGSANDFWTPSGGGDIPSGEADICASSILSDGTPLGSLAVYCNGGLQEVAQKIPNGFGVFDTAGNLWQWVHDESCNIASTPVADPACVGTDPSTENTPRVIKGGAYFNVPQMILPVRRLGQQALGRSFQYGFRIGRIR